jgi:hypothetical protein
VSHHVIVPTLGLVLVDTNLEKPDVMLRSEKEALGKEIGVLERRMIKSYRSIVISIG